MEEVEPPASPPEVIPTPVPPPPFLSLVPFLVAGQLFALGEFFFHVLGQSSKLTRGLNVVAFRPELVDWVNSGANAMAVEALPIAIVFGLRQYQVVLFLTGLCIGHVDLLDEALGFDLVQIILVSRVG